MIGSGTRPGDLPQETTLITSNEKIDYIIKYLNLLKNLVDWYKVLIKQLKMRLKQKSELGTPC